MTNPPQPQWGSRPETPRKRRRWIWWALSAAIILAIGIALGSAGGGGNDAVTPAPSPTVEEPTTPAAPPEDKPATEPEPRTDEQEAATERKDLVRFAIDDRSTAGFKSIWIVWTITNSSSEKSDYTWDWEAIGPNGDRLADSTEYVRNVLPGQTTKGDMPTTLDTANIKLNITDFDRSKSW